MTYLLRLIRLLAVFCVINLLNYVDRGTIASNGVNGSRKTCTKTGTCSPGSGIQGDFDLSNFQDGVISSAFMVGLLINDFSFTDSLNGICFAHYCNIAGDSFNSSLVAVVCVEPKVLKE
ncbi:putative sphingolipid transporter spinster -like 2 [Nicotiana attenuata]|uniref:Sphingolipid transporter spinster -like 2 n=1 Tax=Nicotiana attenuata TaxID=49451 RepID=A0A1J6IMR0_NICAT|nr:putative sphingolipid transporter spinster -like 2 [Nicotiana attenuata]